MTITPGPWSAALSDNSIVALHDGDGKHFANFRNVRGGSPWADGVAIAALPDLIKLAKTIASDNFAAPLPLPLWEQARALVLRLESGAGPVQPHAPQQLESLADSLEDGES